MSIDPLKSGNISGIGRAGQTGAGQAARETGAVRPDAGTQGEAAAARAAGDQVELSAEYQSLVEQVRSGGAAEAHGLSAERLRTIMDRVRSGFYDTPEVRDQIARRIEPDLRAAE
jgi:hypothetical protein